MGNRIFWFFFITTVLLFALLVPPFQKPDEETHFYRAMALADRQLFCTSDTSRPQSFILPLSVYQFPSTMQQEHIIMRYDTKFPIGLLKTAYPYRGNSNMTDAFRYCSLPFISYIPFAVSALISIPFNNLLITFYSMRLVAALMFIMCIFVGFRIIPKRYGLLFLFLAANPMVLHQATSISYDAILLSVEFLIFSLWLACMEEKKISGRKLGILVSLIVLSSIVKPGYWFFAGILIPIIWKVNSKKHILSVIAIMGVVSVVVATAVFGLGFSSFFGNTLDMSHPQIYIFLRDPWYFVTVVWTTIRDTHQELLQGMIGLFGWLDYRIPLYGSMLYAFFGGMVAYDCVRHTVKSLKGWVIALIGIICLSTIVLIFFYFFRSATPFGYKTVIGVQGRYFLPILPFFSLFLLEMFVFFKNKKLLPAIGILFGFISMLIIGGLIYFRYYDYSKNFSNPHELVLAIQKKEIDLSKLVSFTLDTKTSYLYKALYPGYKIGGIQIIVENELDVSVPYRFSIQDGTCRRTLFEGYMNELRDTRLSFLKGEQDIVTEQYFPITVVPEENICVTFIPLMVQENSTYLKLLGDEEKPTVRFLYIAK